VQTFASLQKFLQTFGSLQVFRPFILFYFTCHTAIRKLAFKMFSGNNQATSFPNLVNFCPVISEFTLLKRAIFAAIRQQFVTLAFPNGWEDRNVDFRRVIGNYFCTSCRNLVRFGSVTPEFKT